jgi:hypothetical protein
MSQTSADSKALLLPDPRQEMKPFSKDWKASTWYPRASEGEPSVYRSIHMSLKLLILCLRLSGPFPKEQFVDDTRSRMGTVIVQINGTIGLHQIELGGH